MSVPWTSVVYLDPENGKDGNSGRSALRPKRTFAAADLLDWDCLVLKKGTTLREEVVFSRTGTENQPRMVGAYGTGAAPKITPCDSALGTATDWTGDEKTSQWSRSWPYACKVVLFDGTIGTRQANLAAVTAANYWYSDSATLTVYSLSGNPASAFTSLEAGVRTTGVYAKDKAWLVVDEIHVYGGHSTGATTDPGGGICIDTGCSHVTVKSCTVNHCHGWGIQMLGVATADVHDNTVNNIAGTITGETEDRGDGICFRGDTLQNPSTDIAVYGNRFAGNVNRGEVTLIGADGILVAGNTHASVYGRAVYALPAVGDTVNDLTVQGEDCTYNPAGRLLQMIAIHALEAAGTQTLANVTIRRNTLDMQNPQSGNNTQAIDLWLTGETNLVEGNLVENARSGIRTGAGPVTVQYNWLGGGTAPLLGLRSATSDATPVFHANIVDKFTHAVYLDTTGKATFTNNSLTRFVNYGVYSLSTAETTTLENNIIYTDVATSVGLIYWTSTGTLVSDYNQFYTTDVTLIFRKEGAYYNTLALWAAGTGYDTHSVQSDPLFTDAANADFTLQASSPCVRKGKTLASSYRTVLDPVSVWPDGVMLHDNDRAGYRTTIGAYCPAAESFTLVDIGLTNQLHSQPAGDAL